MIFHRLTPTHVTSLGDSLPTLVRTTIAWVTRMSPIIFSFLQHLSETPVVGYTRLWAMICELHLYKGGRSCLCTMSVTTQLTAP